MKAPTHCHPACLRSAWLAPAALLATLALPHPAHASCSGPEAVITWSYPDETTDAVPPDAVFWAVSYVGDITVEVDGVPLSPRGTSLLERVQFVSATPLSEGEHELIAKVHLDSRVPDAGDTGDERRVRFRVAAAPTPEADVVVSSVTAYPLVFDGSSPTLSPPPSEYDTECSALAVGLSWGCDDIIPAYVTRIAYAFEGEAIAYLVQGDTLVPPGCASYWVRHYGPDADPAAFRVAAVMPTGVAEEHAFAGTVELRTLEESNPGVFQTRRNACSLDFERRPAPPMLLGAATLLVIGGYTRRRARKSA
jgi:hypothetical protein